MCFTFLNIFQGFKYNFIPEMIYNAVPLKKKNNK